MPSLTYPASFGQQVKIVKIVQLQEGINDYQVFVDNYYWGKVQKIRREWTMYMTPKTELTGDDIVAIFEVVEREFG